MRARAPPRALCAREEAAYAEVGACVVAAALEAASGCTLSHAALGEGALGVASGAMGGARVAGEEKCDGRMAGWGRVSWRGCPGQHPCLPRQAADEMRPAAERSDNLQQTSRGRPRPAVALRDTPVVAGLARAPCEDGDAREVAALWSMALGLPAALTRSGSACVGRRPRGRRAPQQAPVRAKRNSGPSARLLGR